MSKDRWSWDSWKELECVSCGKLCRSQPPNDCWFFYWSEETLTPPVEILCGDCLAKDIGD